MRRFGEPEMRLARLNFEHSDELSKCDKCQQPLEFCWYEVGETRIFPADWHLCDTCAEPYVVMQALAR